MSEPKVTSKHTNAFFGASVVFMAVTVVWNLANLTMLDVAVQDRYTIGMGILCSMFATVVVSKVVRDREEANDFVAGLRQARYEEVLAQAPAPGLGKL
ncbi:hypothetical protein [Nakamurella deserti]|uniref:hypothetical protein n=1 Tax=Nakamurella deserti TaxID=2164074 RepID=UPI00130050DD|nr:hypothetical protein [Nakamurella deserti]